MRKLNTTGFTLVELMIAAAVFTVVLLLISTGLINVGRMFFKGVNSSNTQETISNIVNDIADSIRLSGEAVSIINPNADGTQGFCVGTRQYSYLLNSQLTDDAPVGGQSNHVLVVNRLPSCSGTITAQALRGASSPQGKELLSPKMRLTKLSLCMPGQGATPTCPTPSAIGSNIYQVTVRVVFGDDDLLCSPSAGDCNNITMSTNLNNPDLTCKNTIGSQFCSVAELTTSVYKRIQ
jgi:prepilin-type N-terminal cleavage/methylation domain-containing protein